MRRASNTVIASRIPATRKRIERPRLLIGRGVAMGVAGAGSGAAGGIAPVFRRRKGAVELSAKRWRGEVGVDEPGSGNTACPTVSSSSGASSPSPSKRATMTVMLSGPPF